jgi:hypothetical protein
MTEKEIVKAHCNACGHETKHLVVARRVVEDSERIDDYGSVSWTETYEMLECCGCEGVTLRHKSWFSEDPGEETKYYPPRISRQLPKWRLKLPRRIQDLTNEIYAALYNDSQRLVLMGARALVDLVIIDKVGDVGNFKEKLEALEAQGFIAPKSRHILAAAFDLGSAAAHRGHRAKPEHVEHVMDIIENLLQAVYVLEDAAKELKESTPPRKGTKADSQ